MCVCVCIYIYIYMNPQKHEIQRNNSEHKRSRPSVTVESERNCMNTLFKTFGSHLTANTPCIGDTKRSGQVQAVFNVTATDTLRRVNRMKRQTGSSHI